MLSPSLRCGQSFKKLIDLLLLVALPRDSELVGEHILSENLFTCINLRGKGIKKLIHLEDVVTLQCDTKLDGAKHRRLVQQGWRRRQAPEVQLRTLLTAGQPNPNERADRTSRIPKVTRVCNGGFAEWEESEANCDRR